MPQPDETPRAEDLSRDDHRAILLCPPDQLVGPVLPPLDVERMARLVHDAFRPVPGLPPLVLACEELLAASRLGAADKERVFSAHDRARTALLVPLLPLLSDDEPGSSHISPRETVEKLDAFLQCWLRAALAGDESVAVSHSGIIALLALPPVALRSLDSMLRAAPRTKIEKAEAFALRHAVGRQVDRLGLVRAHDGPEAEFRTVVYETIRKDLNKRWEKRGESFRIQRWSDGGALRAPGTTQAP